MKANRSIKFKDKVVVEIGHSRAVLTPAEGFLLAQNIIRRSTEALIHQESGRQARLGGRRSVAWRQET